MRKVLGYPLFSDVVLTRYVDHPLIVPFNSETPVRGYGTIGDRFY